MLCPPFPQVPSAHTVRTGESCPPPFEPRTKPPRPGEPHVTVPCGTPGWCSSSNLVAGSYTSSFHSCKLHLLMLPDGNIRRIETSKASQPFHRLGRSRPRAEPASRRCAPSPPVNTQRAAAASRAASAAQHTERCPPACSPTAPAVQSRSPPWWRQPETRPREPAPAPAAARAHPVRRPGAGLAVRAGVCSPPPYSIPSLRLFAPGAASPCGPAGPGPGPLRPYTRRAPQPSHGRFPRRAHKALSLHLSSDRPPGLGPPPPPARTAAASPSRREAQPSPERRH